MSSLLPLLFSDPSPAVCMIVCVSSTKASNHQQKALPAPYPAPCSSPVPCSLSLLSDPPCALLLHLPSHPPDPPLPLFAPCSCSLPCSLPCSLSLLPAS